MQQWEEDTHAVSKFLRAVSMIISIKDRPRNNIAVRVKREKIFDERRIDHVRKL